MSVLIKHQWKVCPKKGCDCPPRFWGPPSKWGIVDSEMPAGGCVLIGWYCEEGSGHALLYGTVISAGGKAIEPSHDHTYVVGLPGREIIPL